MRIPRRDRVRDLSSRLIAARTREKEKERERRERVYSYTGVK